MPQTIRVYDPRTYPVEAAPPARAEAAPPHGTEDLRRRGQRLGVRSLTGKVIALVDNRKLLAFGAALRDQLLAQGAADVVRYDSPTYRPAADETLDEVAATSDAAITGLGNCGSCTALTCQDGARLSQRGLLSATLIIPQFQFVATTATTTFGYAEHPVLHVREDVDFATGDPLEREAERVARLILTVGG